MAAKKESKTDFERTYVVPLRKGFRNTAEYKKTKKAMTTLRAFLTHHTKVADKDLKVGMHLNQLIWANGIKNPPPRVKVHVVKKGGIVHAELEGKAFKGAVKAEKKKEPSTMQEKLAEKLGVKDEPRVDAKSADAKAEAKPETKAEAKLAEATPETVKAEEKPAQKKKAAPKKASAQQ